jgi:hypothetical protein
MTLVPRSKSSVGGDDHERLANRQGSVKLAGVNHLCKT